MFSLESTSVDAYILPGRPLPIGLLSPESKKSKGSKVISKLQVQVDISSEEEKIAGSAAAKDEAEFAFLPEALGTVRSPKKVEIVVPSQDEDADGNAEDRGVDGTQLPPPPKHDASVAKPKGSTSDLDEIDEILEGIRTGSDAVHFFARYGSETPVKFVHLKLAVPDDSRAFRPYDLERVDLGDLPPDHFIMSPAGVVHVSPGEPSECVALSSWVRQGMIFNILRNIRFYKFFLHRKMFQTWRANVRFQLYAKQRKRVSERLFLTQKTSSKPILAIKRCLMDMQNMSLLQLDLRTTDKATFVEQQSAQCQRAGQLFEESMQHVINEVQQVIAVVTNNYHRAMEDCGMDATASGTMGSPGATTPMAAAATATQAFADDLMPEKVKSLAKMKEEKLERKRRRNYTRIEYRALGDLIRFVDYLTVETLVALAVNSAKSFYEEFIKTRKSGIFETYVRFGGTGTSFSPTCAEIGDALEGLFDTMTTAVGNVNRVSYLSGQIGGGGNAKSMTSSGMLGGGGGANIPAMIRENRQFRVTARSIQERLRADFERADEHAQTFESIRPIYEFNANWDYDEYRAQQHDISELKQMLELISNWNKELEKLRNRPVGVLEVDSKRLKNELVPLREARLQELKDYIKVRSRCHFLKKTIAWCCC